MTILKYFKEIWRGKDTYRILMNNACNRYMLKGQVLDLGSGVNLASYHRFFKKADDMKIVSFDLMMDKAVRKDMKQIDFEKDVLPIDDNSVDTILIFNLLEHIYDNSVLIKEIRRVLRNGGKVIGSVPFLVGYHADRHDYWRFTSESLGKTFLQYGFSNMELKIIGRGPFTTAFFQVEFILPRILKMFFVPIIFFFDKLFFFIKPKINKEKFALGVFFVSSK